MEKLFENEIVIDLLNKASFIVLAILLILIVIWFINKPFSILGNKSIWQRIRGSLAEEFKAELDDIRLSISKVDSKLDNHIADSEERHAKDCRLRILDFNEEIISGFDHTKEHYEELLDIIDKYRCYCNTHPNFPNNKCVLACENIEETYRVLQKEVAKENMKKNKVVKKSAKKVKKK